MILLNRNSRVVLEVKRAQLASHPDLVDNVGYCVQYGEQLQHGSNRLSHRDLFNPVFNETLEFALADSTKLVFRVSSNGVVFGQAEILIMGRGGVTYITTRNRRIVGTLYYDLRICQPPKDLQRHTRGAQSENYAGSGVNAHSNYNRSKLRDKSQEMRPRQERQIKSRETVEPTHSPQLSEELFSTYFKKPSGVHRRQSSDEPEMQVSIDPRDREAQQKRKVLEAELEETSKKLLETRSTRKLLASQIKSVKKQIKQVTALLASTSSPEIPLEDQECGRLLHELHSVENYNRELKRQLAFLQSNDRPA